MNSFIQKLLTFTFKKQCPDIKLITTTGTDVISVTFADGKKKTFKISIEVVTT